MPLDDLKKRLYKHGETFKERMSTPELERATRGRRIKWGEDEKKVAAKPSSYVFWGAVAVFVLIVGGGFFFFFSEFPAFLQIQDIEVEIVGESEVRSGNLATWDVKLTNRSGAALNDVVVVFNYPQDATPGSSLARVITGLSDNRRIFRERRPIGTLAARGTAQETFDAFIFGRAGDIGEVSVVIEYQPEGSNSTFAKDGDFSFLIARAPIVISFELPQEIRTGQDVVVVINYVSQSSQPIEDLYVKASLPRSFEVESVFPLAGLNSGIPFELKEGEMVWEVGTLAPAQSGRIEINGRSEGADLEPKNFSAAVGIYDERVDSFLSYDEALEAVVLRPQFLEVSITANGKAEHISRPGESINFEVIWKNNLPVAVNDAILEVVLDTDVVDLQTLVVERGAYRHTTNSAVWTASSYEALKNIPPGESGSAKFNFKVKSDLSRDSSAVRPVIKADAVFRTTSAVPGYAGVDVTGSYKFEAPVSSRLQLVSSALHFNSPIQNFGPLPPRVGQETTYTVLWSLANMANDLENIVVRSSVPSYVNFSGIIMPADTNLSFNPNTNEIEWRVGFLPAGTGFNKPALQTAFQIGIIPSGAQVGSSPIIIEASEVRGKDRFTEVMLTSTDSRITTGVPDDPLVGFNQRNVVQ